MTDWPFGDLRRHHYRILYADPAWHFNCGTGERSRHPSRTHYRTMRLADIKALPMRELAHPDGARLLMWTTMPMLEQAFEVLKAWGFRYSTGRIWIKLWPKNALPPWDEKSFAHGSGYEVLGNPEPLIIAKIGKPAGIAPP